MSRTLKFYKLEGKEPVLVGDLIDWSVWMYDNPEHRYIKVTDFGDIGISTIFLGFDHASPLLEEHEPILFETMIFGGKHDRFQERYCTYDQALQGHQKCVDMVMKTKEL